MPPSTPPNTTTTTSSIAAQSRTQPTPTDYSAGTSLPAAGIVGIVAAVVFLFGGLAWFAVYALVTKPRREKAAIKRKRERDVRRVWGYGGPVCGGMGR
jgi:hypothetical protein